MLTSDLTTPSVISRLCELHRCLRLSPGTCEIPFSVSLLVYSVLSSPDYRTHLISPLDLGHFMVYLVSPSVPLSLSLSPSLLSHGLSPSWSTGNTAACLCYIHRRQTQDIQTQKPSPGSGNEVVSQASLDPLLHFLGRSLTSVLGLLKLSRARIGLQSRDLPAAGNTCQSLIGSFPSQPPD